MSVAIALSLLAATVVVPANEQGLEAVDLFMSTCVQTTGLPTQARKLDQLPGMSTPLTLEQKNQIGSPGDVKEAWAVLSPHDAKLVLWFAPWKSTCGVSVVAANPENLEAALGRKLSGWFSGLGFTITQQPDQVAIQQGVTVHRAAWRIAFGSHEMAVIASFGDKPINNQQHLMTFSVLH